MSKTKNKTNPLRPKDFKTVERSFPLQGVRLLCVEKDEKIHVIEEGPGTKTVSHYSAPFTVHKTQIALHEWKRVEKILDDREHELLASGGSELAVTDTIVLRKPTERGRKKAARRDPSEPRAKAEIYTVEAQVLATVLKAYGYTLLPSPRMKEDPTKGCLKCTYDGYNRANLLPTARGLRIDFLGASGFVKTRQSAAPIVEEFVRKNLSGWRATGAKPDGRFRVIHYTGSVTDEVLMGFGINPEGKTPDELSKSPDRVITFIPLNPHPASEKKPKTAKKARSIRKKIDRSLLLDDLGSSGSV